MNELFTVAAPSDALALLLERTAPIERTETVTVLEAGGRVTARAVVASETLPAFARSTMDGYAVRAEDTFGASESAPAYLRLCGEVPMGAVPAVEVGVFEAARIHTGAMLPAGADAVVIVEDTNLHGSEVEVLAAAAPGENVIAVGEDVLAGDVALEAGRRLRPQDLGGLSSLGIEEIEVVARPRIAILSTGDEVVPPTASPRTGQVRDVNAATVSAVVRENGGEPHFAGIVGDEEVALEERARSALADADALVLSAGSSVSVRDLTARVVERLGQPGILVHGIALRPGKPTVVALADGKPVIGLPGNPASALIVAWRLVAPMVRVLGGERLRRVPIAREVDAVLTAPVPSRPGREDYVPCRLEREGETLRAVPIFGKSNLIFTLVRADGLAVIPLDRSGLPAGSSVRVLVP